MWYIIIAVIVILCLIYFFTQSNDIHATKSVGIFDSVAKSALTTAKKRAAINPADVQAQFAIGRIHRYNIGENTITPQVMAAYTEVAARPAEMTDFMIDELEGVFNDQLLTINDTTPVLNGFITTAQQGIPEARIASKERRKRAAASAATRSDAIAEYIAASITHTNDPQNVHDTKVNDDLRETLRKLPTVDIDSAIDDARVWLRNNCAEKVHLLTLDMISQGHHISTHNTTESDIFARVWRRCEDNRNKENTHDMKTAVARALSECVENGVMVCINGRVNRILSSLVLLDFDPTVGSAMTHEAYRNEIFQSVGKLIDDEINTAAASIDPELSAVGTAYLTGTRTDNAAETKFHDSVKQKIDKLIDSYSSKLSVETLSRLKEECYVCIE